MYSKNLSLEKSQLAWLDAGVVFASLLVATWLRHGVGILAPHGEPGEVPWLAYLFPAVLMALVVVALFRLQGLYSRRMGPFAEAVRVLKCVGLATMGVLALTFFYRGYSYSRATAVIFLPLATAAIVGARSAYRAYSRALLTRREAARRALIVGFGQVGQHLARALRQNPAYYELVGFLDDDPAKAGGSLEGIPVLGTTRELGRLVQQGDVDEVILAVPSAPQERIMELVGECLRLRVQWKFVPNLCDVMLDRLHVDWMGGLPVVGLRGSGVVGFNWALKRAFDLTFAAAVLAVLSPLFAVIALAIRLTSRGPVIYRQTRIGLHGRPFTFLKFRSMRRGSDAEIHREFTTEWIYGRTGTKPEARSVGAAVALHETPPSGGRGVHKLARDPRVTAVGRVLRRTSLDELPQFWNVLRGDMSVVGPRPAIPYEVQRYTEWHKRRLEVLPGITGLWQISGRNALSFDEMVRLDIEYIETWSLDKDVKIVLKTIPALFGRAY